MRKRTRARTGRRGAKRHLEHRPQGPDVVYTALQELCPDCNRKLGVCQNDGRRVQGLDTMFWMKRRDKRCQWKDCPGNHPLWPALRDLRVVLPSRIYGLDVTLYVGEGHLADGVSLSQIARDLAKRGLPIDQRHTGRVFRDFLALTTAAYGADEEVRTRLRAQGGIVLMVDGVQFEDRSPVLYVVWDALSGQVLFGERKPYRSEEDLIPLLEKVRAMDVPLIAIVTDKEKGLVPAVKQVFPDVPYQYCQTHFLKNCAKPLAEDLAAVQASVKRRAEAVRKLGKRVVASAATAPVVEESPIVLNAAVPPLPPPLPPPGDASPAIEAEKNEEEAPLAVPDAVEPQEAELVREVCELVRVNSRVSGKAPLDPAETKRHERLEAVRTLVAEARKKKVQRRTQQLSLARSSL